MTEPNPKSYLDGILSTYFNECNIVASDAANLSTELLVTSKNVHGRNFQVIGRYEFEHPESFDAVSLGSVHIDSDVLADTNVELVVARRLNAGGEESVNVLFAVVNYETALPIATFSPRTDGRCRFVQIGQEMTEDSLVVTVGESRTQEVEAIKALLNGKYSEEQKHILEAIVTNEVESYRNNIEEFLHASATRCVEAYFQANSSDETRMLTVVDSAGNGERVRLKTAGMFDVSRYDEHVSLGHDLTLFMGCKLESSDPAEAPKKRRFKKQKSDQADHVQPGFIRLYAQIRGDVCIELGSVGIDVNTVFVGQDNRIAETDTLLMLIKILSIDNDAQQQVDWLRKCFNESKQDISGESGVRFGRNSELFSVRSDIKNPIDYHYSLEVLDIQGLHDGGAVVKQKTSYGVSGVWLRTADVDWPEFLNRLNNYYYHLSFSFRLPNLSGQELVFSGLQPEILDEIVSIRQRLEEVFDHGKSPSERLIDTALNAISANDNQSTSVERQATLKARTVGKIETNVSIKFIITRQDDSIRVQLYGRPESLSRDPYQAIADHDLNLSGKNEINDDLAIELAGIIDEVIHSKQA
jgi:hypothetical protein